MNEIQENPRKILYKLWVLANRATWRLCKLLLLFNSLRLRLASVAAAAAPDSPGAVTQFALKDAPMPPNDEKTLGFTNLDMCGICPAGR
jgi:hypothetical protein